MKIESKAQLNRFRTAPRKVRLVIDGLRGKTAQEAIQLLRFSKKHAAIPVKKLIESAAANAVHNYNAKKDSLVIGQIYVNEGKTLYRWMPRAFGRATPIRKRTCHVTVVLEGEGTTASTEKKEKKDVKEVAEPVVEKKAPKEKKADTKKAE